MISEHFDSPTDYQFGPFPADKLIYKRPDLVEFTTPAHVNGLGTMCSLNASDQPIQGFASLDVPGDMSLERLMVRLPSSLQTLTRTLMDYEQANVRNPEHE